MRWEIREEGRDCEGGKRGGGRQNTRGVGWVGEGWGAGARGFAHDQTYRCQSRHS